MCIKNFGAGIIFVASWINQSVTVPLWLFTGVVLIAIAAVYMAFMVRHELLTRKVIWARKKQPFLLDDEREAFKVIAIFTEKHKDYGVDQLHEYTSLSRLATHHALEELVRHRFVFPDYGS